MFRFAHPEFLFLLILLPVLTAIFILQEIRRKRSLKQFGNTVLLACFMPNVSKTRPHVKFYIQLTALTLIIIVLAQPQFGTKVETEKRQGIELMVALDVSNSMMAQDVQPNRLERAKQTLSRLVDEMEGDKIGLIVFAGDAYVQLPITVDHVSAKMFLSSISPNMVPRQGTAIGTAIDMAIKSFGSKKTDVGRAIVVITDGENHEDDAMGAANLAKENGITVHVIGMGKPEGAPIPVPGTANFRQDKEGNVVVSKLNEEMCRSIAQAGGGVYARADNTNTALRAVSKELDALSKAEITTKVFSDYNEQFQSFALIALLLLIADCFVFGRKNKVLSKIRIFDLKEKLNSL
jgi:Ca-activated chloride channel family protein